MQVHNARRAVFALKPSIRCPSGVAPPVAARDPIIGGQWLEPDPGPDATWGLALRILPGFFTRPPMDRDGVGLALAVLVGIEDVIDPG